MTGSDFERRLTGLNYGDHLCAIYDDRDEQMAAAVPFVRDGLAAGDCCAYIADDQTVEEVAAALTAAGVDVDRELERGALRLLTKRDSYLRSGRFDPEAMIDFLRATVEQAVADGFAGFRVTGEMTWALGAEAGCDRLIEYEALLNRFFPGSRAMALCQYNCSRFPPAVIHDVLRTHPLAVLGRHVCSNLYYEPPDLILRGGDEADRVKWMLAQLRQGEEQVAERRRAEDALRESEGRLRAIFEQSTAGLAQTDLDGRFVLTNRRYCEIVGRSESELLGLRMQALTHPDDLPRNLPLFQAAVRDGTPFVIEKRYVRPDGSAVWVSNSVSLVRDQHGRPVGILAVTVDVTERRRSEERLRLLWEAAGVLLAADDPDAMLKSLFAKIGPHLSLDAYFNFAPTEDGDALRLVSCVGIPDGAADDIARLGFGQAVCGAVALSRRPLVATHIQGSDDPRTARVKAFGIRALACNPLLAGDRLLGTLSFASRGRDEFRADELEFLQTITHYVTAAYERIRLIHKLREADRRKDEFLATLAHELRNPLAPIRNALQLLRLTGWNEAVREQAGGMMERQVAQMVRLIDDLLDLSRITRNRLELRRERVELAAAVQAAVETTRPLVEAAGHTLTVALPPEPVSFDADLARLAQVFGNLLTNAAKYTPRGGHVSLTGERCGGELAVRVADDGIGIPADKLLHVFDMFFQVDRSTEGGQGGLGIGLTLVRRLVELHGGTVEARSGGPGRGSEFVVRLPIPHAPVEKPDTPVGGRVAASIRGRILVVDDNVDSAESLAMVLRLRGAEVRTAHDGAVAVEAASGYRPDLILMDIGMPRLDGYDAARRIRSSPWANGVRLVAMTGWGQEEDRRKAREAGFDHHLTKPVDPAALEELLGHLVTSAPDREIGVRG